MALPKFEVEGAGTDNDAAEVFRVTFSTALSTAPRIEAFDNSSVFPLVDASGSTVAKEVFTGTAGNSNLPMISCAATTSASPGSNWKPAVTGGSALINRLEGTVSFVTDPTTPGAGGAIKFNLGMEAPDDATVPSSTQYNHLIQIRFNFTGSAPTLTFEANDSDAGGTEGTPSYQVFTPGTHGIVFANAGTSFTAGPVKLTLATSGIVDAKTVGVVDAIL